MAGVIRQPLRLGALAFGSEGDRASNLEDHVGDPRADHSEQLVELGKALRPLAVELAHVEVKHGGACIIAVDRLLGLLLHGQWKVFRKIRNLPFGTVGRNRNDQLVLVFREQGIVEKLHTIAS